MPQNSKKRITITVVKALQAGETIWDVSPVGFCVRCQTEAKNYGLKYRFNGRQRWLTIGRHGSPWTPETARNEAERLLGMVADGQDPAIIRDGEKLAPTFAEAAERFMSEQVEKKRKERTAIEYRRLLDKIIMPKLGRHRVKDITSSDINRLHDSLSETPYQANRVVAFLSKLFNWSEAEGTRPQASNPCRHVEKFGEKKRERMLSLAELDRLGDALAAYDGSPYTVAAIRLLLLTGARLQEVLTLRWEWVNFEQGEARLPDSKTGAKTVHLPPPALAVLADLLRAEGNPFVIVGRVSGACMVNLEKPWRVIRSTAGLHDVRLHDLRHAYASVAASSGMGLPMIGKILGHTQAQTTARYAHFAPDPVKAAAATVAGKIADALGSKKADAEVILLAKQKP
jgi:integrase